MKELEKDLQLWEKNRSEERERKRSGSPNPQKHGLDFFPSYICRVTKTGIINIGDIKSDQLISFKNRRTFFDEKFDLLFKLELKPQKISN